MRNRIWMPVVGLILFAVFLGITTLVFEFHFLGYIRPYSISLMSTMREPCDPPVSLVSMLNLPDLVYTTNETATISVTLTNDADVVCNHELILSGESLHLRITPANTQKISLNPDETRIVSWTVSALQPTREELSLINRLEQGLEISIPFKFMPPYLGLTANQMFWGSHLILILGSGLIIVWFRDP